MFRIARESYGALAPRPRETADDPAQWSRYDTVGRTIYATDNQLTAYMELLAPYRTIVGRERRALQPLADFMGVELDDLWDDIVSEWEQAGNMKASWLPRSFREGRAMFTLEFPTGWWIDITATETITALHELFENSWPTSDGAVEKPLTVSDLTGEDRILTTAIAEMLRENVTLDDGTLPLGLEFMSKHGHPTGSTGRCWAYWMRGPDSGLAETTQITNIAPILHDDPIFLAALKHCKIKAR